MVLPPKKMSTVPKILNIFIGTPSGGSCCRPFDVLMDARFFGAMADGILISFRCLSFLRIYEYVWPARVCVRHEKCISAAGEAATPRMSFLASSWGFGFGFHSILFCSVCSAPLCVYVLCCSTSAQTFAHFAHFHVANW